MAPSARFNPKYSSFPGGPFNDKCCPLWTVLPLFPYPPVSIFHASCWIVPCRYQSYYHDLLIVLVLITGEGFNCPNKHGTTMPSSLLVACTSSESLEVVCCLVLSEQQLIIALAESITLDVLRKPTCNASIKDPTTSDGSSSITLQRNSSRSENVPIALIEGI